MERTSTVSPAAGMVVAFRWRKLQLPSAATVAAAKGTPSRRRSTWLPAVTVAVPLTFHSFRCVRKSAVAVSRSAGSGFSSAQR